MSIVTSSILRGMPNRDQDRLKKKWDRKLDLNKQAEEILSDMFATMLMGMPYYHATVEEVKTNTFSRLLSAARNGSANKFSHPPQELRFAIIQYVLQQLCYASDERFSLALRRSKAPWYIGFKIMMNISKDARSDPFGGFFAKIFQLRSVLLRKLIDIIPEIDELALRPGKISGLAKIWEEVLCPFNPMRPFYSHPRQLPSSLDIVRGLPYMTEKYSDFAELVRLRAVRAMLLKFASMSSN